MTNKNTMSNTNDYLSLLTEIIQKQIVIIGPNIAISVARNVQGLTITDKGEVTGISGDANEITQNLINEYVSLSGLIVKKAMEPLLAKYPSVKNLLKNSPQN